jgi:lipopolysaccharide transport system ATP-binding protein
MSCEQFLVSEQVQRKMTKAVIQAERLGKRYRIGTRERYRALRDVIASALSAPARMISGQKSGAAGQAEHFWALKDVCFDVREGEVIGLIGRNGAGKSTLLKILARITRPTEGHAEIRGRVGSLLEVGTGFHPELTGRENIYLSGAILGMKNAEIGRKFEEIVAFAEVDRFLDTPLKHYSSGMQMRLAFAVAAHLDPEILLVDEVLAVGDLEFQKKCLGKMGDVAKSGRTIIFVSHQMNQIRRLCEKVIWVDGGKIRQSGATPQIVGAYETAMSSGQSSEREASAAARGRFVSWEITRPQSGEAHILDSLAPVTVKFAISVYKAIRRAHHGIALRSVVDNQLIWARATDRIDLNVGEHELSYTFPMLPLRPGAYSWLVSLYDEAGLVDMWECLPNMIIATQNHQHRHDEWNGVLNMPCNFLVQESSTVADDTDLRSTARVTLC